MSDRIAKPALGGSRSSLSVAPRILETTTRTNRSPAKVALQPGHSPLDWARLKSSSNLRGPIPESQLAQSGRISKRELQKHASRQDAWTVLAGKVYNITPYLDFHPGGVPQLMRAAGKDGTQLFMEFHAWINFDMMLDKCAVGRYVGDVE